jgi:hypothetical protein
MQIFHLSDGDVRAMRFFRALDGGCLGVTAVDRDGLRAAVPAERFLEKA